MVRIHFPEECLLHGFRWCGDRHRFRSRRRRWCGIGHLGRSKGIGIWRSRLYRGVCAWNDGFRRWGCGWTSRRICFIFLCRCDARFLLFQFLLRRLRWGLHADAEADEAVFSFHVYVRETGRCGGCQFSVFSSFIASSAFSRRSDFCWGFCAFGGAARGGCSAAGAATMRRCLRLTRMAKMPPPRTITVPPP